MSANCAPKMYGTSLQTEDIDVLFSKETVVKEKKKSIHNCSVHRQYCVWLNCMFNHGVHVVFQKDSTLMLLFLCVFVLKHYQITTVIKQAFIFKRGSLAILIQHCKRLASLTCRPSQRQRFRIPFA